VAELKKQREVAAAEKPEIEERLRERKEARDDDVVDFVVDHEVSSREAVMENDSIKTREELERRLLAFGIETAGVSDYEIIYARAQAIFDDYAGEMTDEIKQWRRYWDKCRDLLRMVGTEKPVMKSELRERVTYDGVVGDITEWLVRGATRPNRTLAMGVALASDGRDADGSRLGYGDGPTNLGEAKAGG
jgi:hypothetical protein